MMTPTKKLFLICLINLIAIIVAAVYSDPQFSIPPDRASYYIFGFVIGVITMILIYWADE